MRLSLACQEKLRNCSNFGVILAGYVIWPRGSVGAEGQGAAGYWGEEGGIHIYGFARAFMLMPMLLGNFCEIISHQQP